MLGKLLKYEFKATGRFLLPIYAALLVFAGINKIFVTVNAEFLNIPSVIAAITYGLLIAATFAVTVYVIIERFYKNLLSSEGYLMFTLPVKPWKNIATKLIVSIFWVISSCIIGFISVIIIAYKSGMMNDAWNFIVRTIEQAHEIMNGMEWVVFAEFVVLLLISLITTILLFYTAISVGQLFSKNRVLASIGAFVGINMIYQIGASIILVLAGHFTKTDLFAQMSTVPTNFITYLLGGVIVLDIVLAIVYFGVSNYILSNKLNLE